MIAGIIAGILIIIGIATMAFLNQPSFGQLPRGERLERIKRSPQYRDGEFKNRQPTSLMTSQKGRFQALWGFLVNHPDRLYPNKPVSAIKTDLKALPRDSDYIVWFGHSSYLMQLSGKRILVDPVFCMASPVSFVNKPFKGTNIYTPDDMPDIDYLVISHDHWDHLDYHTVVSLKNRIQKVVCPLGVGQHFEYWGFDIAHLVELDWNETAKLDDGFRIDCLPARHFSGRGLTSNQSLWASFMLDTPSLKVFIGGDSGYDTHFAEIGKAYPNIDLAILENGQYNEEWRYIHTMPAELGREAKELGAKRIMTVHHSKYALARHAWDEPLRNEQQAARDYSLQLLAPIIGEVVWLEPPRTAEEPQNLPH